MSFTQERQRTKASRWASFVSEHPRLVMVLAYQRSGSTFFGELFNKDIRAFYLFEPLDGLYSSIYGTLPGWNIPSDIYTYVNGSQRYGFGYVSTYFIRRPTILHITLHCISSYFHLEEINILSDVMPEYLIPCNRQCGKCVQAAFAHYS